MFMLQINFVREYGTMDTQRKPPPFVRCTIAFRPQSLVKTSKFTLPHTDRRKDVGFGSHKIFNYILYVFTGHSIQLFRNKR
jgi:hypothetical protein